MKNTDKSCGLKRCLQPADTPIVDTKYKYKYNTNTNEMQIRHVQFYNGGPIFEMPMSGLLVHTLWSATSSSWIFFNREALGWVVMLIMVVVMMKMIAIIMVIVTTMRTIIMPWCPVDKYYIKCVGFDLLHWNPLNLKKLTFQI